MQPAYYENLEEIQKKLWSMLDDAVINRSSPFRIPVFICADQNEVDGRIVVLRKSDRNSNVLQFHTDLRSPKVDILKKNNNAFPLVPISFISILYACLCSFLTPR
mgnify:CR=1 FL=1